MGTPSTSPRWSPALSGTGPSAAEEPASADVPEPDEPTGAALLEQAIRVGTGLVALGIAALGEAIARTLPAPSPSDELGPDHADPLGLATGAALGLTLSAGDLVANTVGRLARAAGPPVAWAASIPPLGPAAARVRATAVGLDQRWRTTRPRTETVAAAFVRELAPQVVDAVLDQLDLTWIVAERVDLDELASRIDLDAVVGRVNLDAAIERVDIERVIARVDLDEIASRIDVEAVVARVDVDAVARRIDLDAVVDRIDLVALAREVVEELDLPEIIRESSGAMASETVRGVRMQGIEADEAVARIVDRMLLRRGARRTDIEPDPTGSDRPGPSA